MKSGFVAIVGRPNVGKSTLLNAILNKKISIVTNKSQTTRNTIKGIYNEDDLQIIFVDTPGVHKPMQKLGEEMNKMVYTSSHDADAVILVVDASKEFGLGDEFLINKLDIQNTPLVIVFNKIDQARLDKVLLLKEKYKEFYPNARVIDTVAIEKFNIDNLISNVKEILPEGPMYYPNTQLTDKDEVFDIKEIIREKILNELSAEVPHSIAVYVDNVEWEDNPMPIKVTLFCEKDSQKGIIIGANGKRIKEIGTKARKSLEAKFHKHIYLELMVKVDEDWRNKEKSLATFGYKTETK